MLSDRLLLRVPRLHTSVATGNTHRHPPVVGNRARNGLFLKKSQDQTQRLQRIPTAMAVAHPQPPALIKQRTPRFFAARAAGALGVPTRASNLVDADPAEDVCAVSG